MKSGLHRTFYFEISPAPSELLLLSAKINLPRKAELAWQLNLKGLVEFQKKILDHFSSSFLTQKCWFQDLRF